MSDSIKIASIHMLLGDLDDSSSSDDDFGDEDDTSSSSTNSVTRQPVSTEAIRAIDECKTVEQLKRVSQQIKEAGEYREMIEQMECKPARQQEEPEEASKQDKKRLEFITLIHELTRVEERFKFFSISFRFDTTPLSWKIEINPIDRVCSAAASDTE